MKHEVFISFFEIMKDGKLVLRQREKANSYVVAYNHIHGSMLGAVAVTTTDTSNTGRSLPGGTNSYATAAALAADSTYGIVVGSSNTAVAIADYKLGTQITHGATSGLLQYGASTVISPATVGSYSSWFLTRSFLNSSGANITIYETGIYAKAYSNWLFLIERNIPTPYVCANTFGCVVSYEFRTTV
jgi:hypothetical protein